MNGAGKSTMIKLLTGEMEPCEGIVWKHPNTRVAYVAQHAFHHVEQVRPLGGEGLKSAQGSLLSCRSQYHECNAQLHVCCAAERL